MKQPDDQYNQAQLKFLSGLSGEEIYTSYHGRIQALVNAETF